MSIIKAFTCDGSRSATDIKREMICWQLVPVKKLELNNYLRLYVDNVMTTVMLYRKDTSRSKIILVSDPKARFYSRQSERDGKRYLRKDTALVLYDTKLEESTHNNVDHSCVE